MKIRSKTAAGYIFPSATDALDKLSKKYI